MLTHAWGDRAPSRTLVTFSPSATVVVKSSGSLYICSFEVRSTIIRTITLQDKDGVVYTVIRARADQTLAVPIPWVAANGLTIICSLVSANTSITLFHNSIIGS